MYLTRGLYLEGQGGLRVDLDLLKRADPPRCQVDPKAETSEAETLSLLGRSGRLGE